MTDTMPPAAADLTDQEREADLDLDQLKQLVGLVEYDENTIHKLARFGIADVAAA